jgi:hypothetical protein
LSEVNLKKEKAMPVEEGAVVLKIVVTGREAARGVIKTIRLADGRGAIRIRLPAGIPHRALIRISAPGEDNELFARVEIMSRSRRAPSLVLAAVFLILIVLWISTSGSGGGSANEASPADTNAPATSSVSVTTPQTMSAADYKTMLSGINSVLASDMDGLGKAHSAADISTMITKLTEDVTTQALSLSTDVPTSDASANTTLSLALTSFGGDVSSTASQADGAQICTGEAAIASISRSAGATALRNGARRRRPVPR